MPTRQLLPPSSKSVNGRQAGRAGPGVVNDDQEGSADCEVGIVDSGIDLGPERPIEGHLTELIAHRREHVVGGSDVVGSNFGLEASMTTCSGRTPLASATALTRRAISSGSSTGIVIAPSLRLWGTGRARQRRALPMCRCHQICHHFFQKQGGIRGTESYKPSRRRHKNRL